MNTIQCPKCWDEVPRLTGAAQLKCPKCGTAIRVAPAKAPAANRPAAGGKPTPPVQAGLLGQPDPFAPADPFADDPFQPSAAPTVLSQSSAAPASPARRSGGSGFVRGLLVMATLLAVGVAGATVFFWDRVKEEVANLRQRAADSAAAPSAQEPGKSDGNKMEPELDLDLAPAPDPSTPGEPAPDAPIVVPELPGIEGPANPGLNFPLLPSAGPVSPKAPNAGSDLPPGLQPKTPPPPPDAITKTNPSEPAVKSAIADQYQAIKNDYETNLQKLQLAFRAAKTAAERQRVAQQIQGLSIYPTRMLELADKNPKDPVAVDALVWAGVYTLRRDELQRIVETILMDHIKSPRIARICLAMIERGYPDSEKSLLTILDKNSHREVRAYACLALGIWFKGLSEQTGFADVGEKAKKAEEYFDRVVKQFEDVKLGNSTMGEAVKPQLQELRTLGIGKVAPEIEGVDSGGRRFKLSDYRGKVVVLKFWGSY